MALNTKSLGVVIAGVGVAFAAGQANAQTYAYETEQQAIVQQTTTSTVSSLSVGNIGARIDSVTSGVTGGSVGGGAGGGAGGSVGGGNQTSFLPQSSTGGTVGGYQSNEEGKAAGSLNNRLGVWAFASYAKVNNTKAAPVDTRFDGDVWAVNVGADYLITDQILVGATVGYAKADIQLKFNNGTYDLDGYSVSPYMLFILNKYFSVSAAGGYVWSDIEQTSQFNANRGSQDADTYFGTINGAFKYEVATNLFTTFRAGYLYSNTDVSGITFSGNNVTIGALTVETSQLKAGVEVAYSIQVPQGFTHANTFQPYAYTDYLYDTVDEVNGDSDAYRVGGGLRIASWDGTVSGSIEGNSELGRQDISVYGVQGTIRFKF